MNSNHGGNVSGLSVALLNARSLKSVNQTCNKLFQLQNIASVDNGDIIAVTESWHNSSVKDSEILNCNYVIYRRDRQCYNRSGGVLLAVNHWFLR